MPGCTFWKAAIRSGMTLVNRQTGPEGKLVRKVLVTKAVDVQKEYYLGIALDSANATMVIIASASGGMEIEETSKNDPSAIIRVPVSIMMGYKRYEGLQIADALGLAGSLQEELIDLLGSMAEGKYVFPFLAAEIRFAFTDEDVFFAVIRDVYFCSFELMHRFWIHFHERKHRPVLS